MLSRNPIIGMDKKSPAICVFCGSAYGNNPKFRDAARAVGAGIAAGGFSMVFGGGSNGLMGDVAAAAGAGGARVQGIIPAFLQALEGLEQVTAEEKLIITPHMQERKTLMLQMSDAFLVLPGGLGTFDEFFEVATEAQLGVHRKPIIVVNVDGYFDALDSMLRSTVEKGFAKPLILELYHLADGPEAALLALREALGIAAKAQALAPSR
ncbi:MAG TPA: TIGR00730 family Rossman fold protein [Rhizomicrobium sp.]|jgi:hypothetical protein|nr:TIGR00730 family Rossman fold protein [Rhizomicrobium sp.]